MSSVVLPVELNNLIQSINARLTDLDSIQLPNLSTFTGSTSDQLQLTESTRNEISGIRRDLDASCNFPYPAGSA
jgi:hypothetical protein